MKQNISDWYIISIKKDGVLWGYYRGQTSQYHPANLDNADRAKIYRTLEGANRAIKRIQEVIYRSPEFEVIAEPFSQFVNNTQMELCGWVVNGR